MYTNLFMAILRLVTHGESESSVGVRSGWIPGYRTLPRAVISNDY